MKRAAHHLLLLAAASSAASLATPPRPLRPNRAAADALGAAVPSPQLDPALVAELSEAVAPPPSEAASEAALLDPVKFAFNTAIVDSVKGLIDLAYPDRPFARFYVLETAGSPRARAAACRGLLTARWRACRWRACRTLRTCR